MVAISVLILRYVPPDEVPLPASLQDSIDSVSLPYGSISQDISGDDPKASAGSSTDSSKPLLDSVDIMVELPLIEKQLPLVNCKFVCLFVFFFEKKHLPMKDKK
jgi:cationic amino acid transporter 1